MNTCTVIRRNNCVSEFKRNRNYSIKKRRASSTLKNSDWYFILFLDLFLEYVIIFLILLYLCLDVGVCGQAKQKHKASPTAELTRALLADGVTNDSPGSGELFNRMIASVQKFRETNMSGGHGGGAGRAEGPPDLGRLMQRFCQEKAKSTSKKVTIFLHFRLYFCIILCCCSISIICFNLKIFFVYSFC